MNDLQGRTFLVIDDDPNLRRLVENTFSQVGAEVVTAASGMEGLLLLPAHEPDLVILDVMMPEMDGWEVCSRIRPISDVPIIFVSAMTGDPDIIRGLDCGAADYVAWRDNVGAPAGTLPNDAVGGIIGQGQYDNWKANFGNTLPEPATLGLLAIGLLAVLRRKSK